tara:strand:+ start:63 stop:227 length:165 start_codon:yes stop_codon:yes gene_type:complete
MKSDLYHITKRLQTLSISLQRQHRAGHVDLQKIELIEIYVEIVEIMLEVLEGKK